MAQVEVTRTLLDILMHLTNSLEAMEDSTTQSKIVELENRWEEDREAYMQKLEEEDVDTWIEMLYHDEYGNEEELTFPSPPYF